MQSGDRLRSRLFGAEFAFPLGDDGGGETVADDVDDGAAHVHDGVDAEDDEDGLDGQREVEAVARITTRTERATPATPLLVNMRTPTTVSWRPRLMWMPASLGGEMTAMEQ